jgi:hypothetical protein
LVPSSSFGVAFSRGGTAIAASNHHVYPFISAYTWSASGWGTQYSSPADPPYANTFGVAFGQIG